MLVLLPVGDVNNPGGEAESIEVANNEALRCEQIKITMSDRKSHATESRASNANTLES